MSNTLCEPPRRLSAKLKLHLLCSGSINQFGWGIVFVSMINVWVFVFFYPQWIIRIETVIIPMAGLVLVAKGIKQSRKMINLMKKGKLAQGKYLKKKATNMYIDKRMVYKVIYAFKDNFDQKHEVQFETHLTENLPKKENILYDPLNPEIYFILSNLKKYYHISVSGNIELASKGWFWVLFLPLLTLAAHGSIFVYYCFMP